MAIVVLLPLQFPHSKLIPGGPDLQPASCAISLTFAAFGNGGGRPLKITLITTGLRGGAAFIPLHALSLGTAAVINLRWMSYADAGILRRAVVIYRKGIVPRG